MLVPRNMERGSGVARVLLDTYQSERRERWEVYREGALVGGIYSRHPSKKRANSDALSTRRDTSISDLSEE